MNKGLICSVAASILLAACAESPVTPSELNVNSNGASLAAADGGGWAAMVTGGGRNHNANPDIIEWISLSVRKNASGEVSGMYEYANVGYQDWRYRGEPDCLAISADGKTAVVIGPVTNTQSRETTPLPLGTRVGFMVTDNGTGQNDDSGFAFFAGFSSCEAVLGSPPGLQPNSGNYRVAQR